ncbi:MurR/RpiR family transcriptional regulator [Stenotrophomonas acidaminiphila]|uniref:MurR/RpiR family transcriptional regulator n=1 Tax=Stenotrophomonas TaxID=40323 RepID=UPI000CDC4F60|nr:MULTISPECIES: MurR/RpiR family transcriptional regulator [Stenotrophomonas]AUZ54295.1 MurR/RpiR family transcriptional regulator [Stenotrophomonas acidaminiphila]MCH1910325.1 MurR/RpiR family transcriptional regulator [Stenotrophomonas sp. Y6]MPS34152.1 MurR/RpiR family transcriptional regulator [Stenotrophomonas sp.]MTI75544.1 MurR/RpiR family transcriptional regulator [Stenotrophomonas sp.]NCT86007.1 MurR/RpiR family transcriptional regulator [Stenotrophomonas acidaminiphila]
MFDIVYELRQRLHEFSPVEVRIANTILADVDAAAQYGVTELAERAEVSAAAISRFAKTLGCEHVRELRARLASASAVGKRFLEQQNAPPVSALFAQICDDIQASLRHNLANLQEEVVQQLADAICQARRIHVFGIGGCSTVFSQELQNRLMRFGLPITACSDAVVMKMTAAILGPQDLVLALSVSGITPEVISAVEIARTYGARVGAITRAGTALAERSDWLLPISIEETDFVFKPSASRYAMMLAIDVLATTTALNGASENHEHLRRIKLALDRYRGGDSRLPLGD